jgi:hypothetical protein
MECVERTVVVNIVIFPFAVQRITKLLSNASTVVPCVLIVLNEKRKGWKLVVIVQNIPKVHGCLMPLVDWNVKDIVRILLVINENVRL